MANWTNIPTDRIEPGKPIRAIDGLALRDNPIAMAEGASGAPRIMIDALEPPTAGSGHELNGNVSVSGPGDNSSDWSSISDTNKAFISGDVRVNVSISSLGFNGTGRMEVELYKNNTLIHSYETAGPSGESYTVDTSVKKGDKIGLRVRRINPDGGTGARARASLNITSGTQNFRWIFS